MKDRAGNAYQVLTVRLEREGKDYPICRISPARQEKKTRGLTGRQDKKWQKAQRRKA